MGSGIPDPVSLDAGSDEKETRTTSQPIDIRGWRECRATLKKGHILAIRSGIYALAALLALAPVLESQNQTVGLFLNNSAKTSPDYTPARATGYFRFFSKSARMRLYSSAQLAGSTKAWFSTG